MVELRQLEARPWPVGEYGGGRVEEGERRHWKENAIGKRCRQLRQAGYLDSRRWFFDRPAVWTATAAGLREAGLPLEPAVVDHRIYDHDLAVGWLCLQLEEEHPAVLTDREIAAADAGLDSPIYSAGQGTGLTRRKHRPDLALEAFDEEGRPLAIEVERTPKSARRLLAIVELYAAASHLAGVRYYVTSDRSEAAVNRGIEQLRGSRTYAREPEVIRWVEPEGVLPPASGG